MMMMPTFAHKKSVSFSFLHPESSNSPFGLSYYYDIRLAKSKLNLINIEKSKEGPVNINYTFFVKLYSELNNEQKINSYSEFG